MITPHSNAKLERMFSTMDSMKTEWRNRMGRDILDASLRIREGVPVANYCPGAAIDLWFNSKVCRVNSSSHSYPKK